MKALTVHQPWADAIASGRKQIENRGTNIAHRGLLAIHAGKKLDYDALDLPHVRRAIGVTVATFGAIVAVADLADAHGPTRGPLGSRPRGCGHRSPWAQEHAGHWQLADIRALDRPVPCRGMQGLWTVPDDVEQQVLEQLGQVGA